MIQPKKLNKGDTIAAISLSWGGAGAIPHRYEAGKQQLEKNFDVKVVPTRHALKSADWIAKNPKARAEDLMEALEDSSIKAIISNIGGDDSIRTLPYVDLEIIKNNPKIFLGYSDSTVTHFCFYKAGITSFYGTSMMVGFAENGGMFPYDIKDIQQNLFDSTAANKILPNAMGWTSERLAWDAPANQAIKRKLSPCENWTFLQGQSIVRGELIGGCVSVLEFLKDTPMWVQPEDWNGKIMFLETSEEKMNPGNFLRILRNYAASGILHQINGLLLGRPYDNLYKAEYDAALLSVIKEEEGLIDLPIITGMDFGHTCPIFTLPYGVMAEINCLEKKFSILESGVIDSV